MLAGSTYAPEGVLRDDGGREVELPADMPAICALAQCCALCNDSSLYYAPGDTSKYTGKPWTESSNFWATSLARGPKARAFVN